MTIRNLSRIVRRNISLVAALIALALMCPQAAHAGGVVSTCSELPFRAAVFGGGKVTFSCSGTITLTVTITISDNTTIDGSGQSVAISGGHSKTLTGVQLFDVKQGITFNLNRITVANGNSGTNGGGIFNNGTVTVTHSTFRDNTAGNNGSGDGGAIYNNGTLTVSHSTFRDNTTGGFANNASDGGAIYNNGELTVTNSSFDDNTASGQGGGIYDNSGVLLVTDSVFYSNSAAFGGGISNHAYFVSLTNTTFDANTAFNDGGSIYNAITLYMDNDTLAEGRANGPGGSEGGNVSNSTGGSLYLQNTIVASSVGGPNCKGSVTDGGGNLSWPSGDLSCNLPTDNPHLGVLQNNGGPTWTMALLTTSPKSAAINAAIDAFCPSTDQRGVIRPQGPHCDIGAYEANTAISLVGAVLNHFNSFLSSLLSEGALDKVSGRVVIPLEHSLNPDLWPEGDGNHINGGEVFTLQRDVVDRLSEFIVDPTQLAYINNLVMADRTLAMVAMNDKGCGANPNPAPNANVSVVCAQAAAELAAGDARAGRGEYGEAIGHYLKVWQLATP